MTTFDPPSDPYGNEVHCPICDYCMEKEDFPGGGYICNQIHEDELCSQEDYIEKPFICPHCGSDRVEIVEVHDYIIDKSFEQECCCASCKMTYYDQYKLVGFIVKEQK
jgi:hypothetical protein